MQRVETLDHQVDTLGKTVETMGQKINGDQSLIQKLTHEITQLKRFKFAKRSEQLISPDQASLLEYIIDADIAAELQTLQTAPVSTETKQKPKRTAAPPPDPPRTGQHTLHLRLRPQTHLRGCQRKTRYTPGVFSVERHIRGKWVCGQCEALIQAPAQRGKEQ